MSTPVSDPVVRGEEVIAPRVRRPFDLARMIIAVLIIVVAVALGLYATATTAGIGEDLGRASKEIPFAIELIIDLIAIAGLLALPTAACISMLVRRRGGEVVDSLIALAAALVILLVASTLISDHGSANLILALTGHSSGEPLVPALGALVAFITTARIMSRPKWSSIAFVVVVALSFFILVGISTSISGVVATISAGWFVGLVVRYVRGTLSTRPSGTEIGKTLQGIGLPISALEAERETDWGRRYRASVEGGQVLELEVLDRDREGAGLIQWTWSWVRLRDPGNRVYDMRRTLDHKTLMYNAGYLVSAPTTELVATCEVSADSSLLAYVQTETYPLADADLTDEQLDQAWTGLQRLQTARLAHRRLNPDNVQLLGDDIHFRNIGEGTVAANDVTLRIDRAELLCTLALEVGAERAIASATRVLGFEEMSKARAVLQPIAFSAPTKAALRKNKELLKELKLGLSPGDEDTPPEEIDLQRIKPRTVLMASVGVIAAYVIVTQLVRMLSGVDLGDVWDKLDWWWIMVALFASLMTYPGAAWSLSGFVPEKLKLLPTTMAQLAADFATLVTPPTLGAVAVNLRYLQKLGIHPALASASIGVSQVIALAVHTLLLLTFGILLGTSQTVELPHIPAFVFLIVGIVLAIGAGLLLLPISRRFLWQKVAPMLKQIGPRLVDVATNPMKLLEGIGGMLVLNLGFICALAACVEAFGGGISFAAIAVVYLTASVVGSAAPTPGGLGAIEAVMTAALTAAGMDGAVALMSVLAYRLLTFVLPTIPGYFSLHWLQRHNYL